VLKGTVIFMLPQCCLPSMLRAARLGLAFLGLTALTASQTALASPSLRFQILPGHIPAAVASAKMVSALSRTQMVGLALVLPLRHQAELTDLLHGLSDPSDPRYGQFLTSDQFEARYSPTPEEYSRVIAYAKAMGFSVTATHASRTLLDVSAPTAQVEEAFGLHLLVYRAQADGRYFYAPDAEPQVPSALASLVTGVIGLSSASRRQPHLIRQKAPEIVPMLAPYNAPLQTGSGPGGALSPSDIKAAYNLSGVSQNGSGQTLGLFELDGYTASDITAYESAFGLPNVPLQTVLIDGFNGAPTDPNGSVEVTLDIELQAALAPSASKILVYEGPNTDQGVVDTYNKIASDNSAKEVSTSWGEAETETPASVRSSENTAFQQMAAQGQSIFAASGDQGAYDTGHSSDGLTVDDPSSQPYMVGVGGTSLATNGAGGPYGLETTWNNNIGAGGGGISTVWTIPSYQSGLAGSAASQGSTTHRNVPDVSLDADPYTGYDVYYNGGWAIYGGTSCAAPLWAAFTSLVNQKRTAAGLGLLGFANPPIYSLASSASSASDFHDIADGSTNYYYPTVAGYDDATGWGTFNGANLLADLSGSTSTPPVSSTLVNDTNGGLAYTGSGWFYSAGRGLGDVQDDVHATTVNGDSVSYIFTGSAISYISETNADEGSVQVYLDGTLQATVNAYSATRQVQQALWSKSGLTSGSHTVKLVKASGTYLLLDALVFTPLPPAAGVVNDTNSSIVYTGASWGYYPNRGTGDVQDDVHAASANGDFLTFSFTGASISYITETNADEGTMDVYLDGILQTTVNGYSPTRQAQQALWSKTGLAAGSHTLKLIKTGGSYLLVDAFAATPASSVSVTTLNDTSSGLAYSGSGWFYSTGRGLGDVDDDIHATTVNGDSVVCAFTGTSVSYFTETNSDEGTVDVYMDGVFQQTVNCFSASRQVDQNMYSVSGLMSGPHTLNLVKTSGTYLLVDAFRFQ
jgi:hypothetical protein